jgi:hypothetical protein
MGAFSSIATKLKTLCLRGEHLSTRNAALKGLPVDQSEGKQAATFHRCCSLPGTVVGVKGGLWMVIRLCTDHGLIRCHRWATAHCRYVDSKL